ncbi:MAG: tetraacyldisaccharide 4'-kinase [Flavobacteriaceae bacterium]|nr:tetraacyldisaccharide 4'-kinase [Flavobacteriaceae bacterium]
MYDKSIFTSVKFSTPTIVVGNLNVGGTGKSPQIEYLIRLLHKKYKVAVLSRGYKRKTKGFQLADKDATAQKIGDEPMQFYDKFNNIYVAVDSNRVNGVNQLNNLKVAPEVILLDDAFQHRKITGGLNILLTTYQNLYVNDTMLPTGNLRENKEGAKRAQVIMVSKCPETLTGQEQLLIEQKLKPKANQKVFFSTIVYSPEVLNDKNKINFLDLLDYQVILVTGIANADPLLHFLNTKNIKFKHFKYKDHYNFSNTDKEKIKLEFDNLNSDRKIILTTEKDYIRSFLNFNVHIYYLTMQTKLLNNEEGFNKLILSYVQQNSGNS